MQTTDFHIHVIDRSNALEEELCTSDLFPTKRTQTCVSDIGWKGPQSAPVRRVVEHAASAHVVLVEWSTQLAPLVGTISYALRATTQTPLIVATSGDAAEQAIALTVGADAITPRPVHVPLLGAQVLAYRRSFQKPATARFPSLEDLQPKPADAVVDSLSDAEPSVSKSGVSSRLVLDSKATQAVVNGTPLSLTPRQFALLLFLAQNTGRDVSREHILQEVWGVDFDPGTNTVDVYIHYLRRKLENAGLHDCISTVRGVGYRFQNA